MINGDYAEADNDAGGSIIKSASGLFDMVALWCTEIMPQGVQPRTFAYLVLWLTILVVF